VLAPADEHHAQPGMRLGQIGVELEGPSVARGRRADHGPRPAQLGFGEKADAPPKAARALPPCGALIVYERLIDDARRASSTGLLSSLNMLIMTDGGFDFTAADCIAWMRDAGFRDARCEPLCDAHFMIAASK
jgi:hypothetical protein